MALAWGKYDYTVVIEAQDQQGETLIAGLCVRGVWLPRAEVLFDIHVVDTDTQSYLLHAPSRVMLNVEVEKKNNYTRFVLLDVLILHPCVFLWMD